MMMSLFSVFDPLSMGLSLNWLILLMVYFSFILMVYVFLSVESLIFYNLKILFLSLLSDIVGKKLKFLAFVGCGLLMFIMLNNLMGLWPFVFVSTSHPYMTMGIGVLFWLVGIMMGVMKKINIFLGHFTPAGSPLLLAPLLVLIELVSCLIRPFTLSIRLAANLMAGHLIVGLLASFSMSYMCMVSIFMQMVMLILEIGVSIIQGVVFSILFVLYCKDYY